MWRKQISNVYFSLKKKKWFIPEYQPTIPFRHFSRSCSSTLSFNSQTSSVNQLFDVVHISARWYCIPTGHSLLLQCSCVTLVVVFSYKCLWVHIPPTLFEQFFVWDTPTFWSLFSGYSQYLAVATAKWPPRKAKPNVVHKEAEIVHHRRVVVAVFVRANANLFFNSLSLSLSLPRVCFVQTLVCFYLWLFVCVFVWVCSISTLFSHLCFFFPLI